MKKGSEGKGMWGGEERKRMRSRRIDRGGVLWEYNIAGHGDRLVCKRDKMMNH